MDNCSIQVSCYNDYSGRDWYIRKIDGEWLLWERYRDNTYREGRQDWSWDDNRIAERMIDDLVADAIAKIEGGAELEDCETLASATQDGITVDIYYHIPEED